MNPTQSGITSARRIVTLVVGIVLMVGLSCEGVAQEPSAALCEAIDAAAERRGILPIPDYSGSLSKRGWLIGDWCGRRTSLAEQGISFQVVLTQTFQTVVDGGLREAEEYGGKFETLTNLDLDRMGAIRGALLTMRTESRYGNSVNGDSGTILPVNDVMFFPLTDRLDDDIPITITELRYTQFLSKTFGVFVGKFTTLGGDYNEFAGGRGDTQFMSLPFAGPSVTALCNPYSTLGGGMLWMPSPRAAFSSTIYQTTDSSTATGFDNFGDGWTWNTSARLQYQLCHRPGGVMGSFTYAFDNSFIDFGKHFVDVSGNLAVPTSSETWLAYFNAWQYLVVEGKNDAPVDVTNARVDRQGVGLFARVGFADRDTNPVEWIVSGGVGGRGIIPGRDRDTFGIGYAHAKLRDAGFLTGPVLDTTGSRFEAYYNISLTPAAELTFDLQVADSILAPLDPARILGVRLRLQF